MTANQDKGLRIIKTAAGMTDKRHRVIDNQGKQVFPRSASRAATFERCCQFIQTGK